MRLTNEQHALVMQLVSHNLHRARWVHAQELLGGESSDADIWIESLDEDIRMLWAELNGVEL